MFFFQQGKQTTQLQKTYKRHHKTLLSELFSLDRKNKECIIRKYIEKNSRRGDIVFEIWHWDVFAQIRISCTTFLEDHYQNHNQYNIHPNQDSNTCNMFRLSLSWELLYKYLWLRHLPRQLSDNSGIILENMSMRAV